MAFADKYSNDNLRLVNQEKAKLICRNMSDLFSTFNFISMYSKTS